LTREAEGCYLQVEEVMQNADDGIAKVDLVTDYARPCAGCHLRSVMALGIMIKVR